MTGRNNGMAAVWGNHIHNEAIFVDSLRQNQLHVFLPQQQLCGYYETTSPNRDIPPLNPNPIIPPNSTGIHYGLSDEHLMQNAAGGDHDGSCCSSLERMMMQNVTPASDDDRWSLLDQMMMQRRDDDGNLLGEQVMKQNGNEGGDDGWLPPNIQGSNYGVRIDNNLPLPRNQYPDHHLT